MTSRRSPGEDFAHSITDLMTSIAVVFVLLFLFFAQQQKQETEEKVSETERIMNELLVALQEEFGPFDIDVSQREGDPLTLEVTLPERYRGSLTFLQNQHTLLDAGRDLLDKIVPKLLGIVCSERFADRMESIVVEGHASTEGQSDWNVELSAMRATAALLYSLKGTPAGTQRECFKQRAAASGRGPWHPKLVAGEEDRVASRRVVFRIRAKSFEQRFQERPTPVEGAVGMAPSQEAGIVGGSR